MARVAPVWFGIACALLLGACLAASDLPGGTPPGEDGGHDPSSASNAGCGLAADRDGDVEADAGSASEPPGTCVYVSDPTSGDWYPWGSKPKSYAMGKDAEVTLHGKPVGGLRSTDEKLTLQDFGSWTARLPRGISGTLVAKRVRMSAQVKTEGLEDWAGLWMRVDGPLGGDGIPKLLGFDNMGDRPILGTTDWTRYEVVLDVPKGMTAVVFGLLVSSKGNAWLGPVTFELVDASVPVTATLPAGY